MDYQTISVEQDGYVATLTLNRPAVLNALNYEMMLELNDAVAALARDASVRAVILTGAGRAFSAGGDVNQVKNMTQEDPWGTLRMRDYVRHYGWVARGLWEMEKPVVAAVNGPAIGAGCNIATAADICIASEKATFAEVFALRGLIPDLGGLYFLPRLVGPAKAKEMCFLGETIDAQEALRIGLVNRVVRGEQLMLTAKEMAGKMAANPPVAMAMTKSYLHRCLELDLRALLEYEALAQAVCLQTEDHQEALNAFFAKREPHYRGC